MEKADRTNFYDSWILPVDPIESTLDLYWPTDEEFTLVFNTIMSKALFLAQVELHGADGKELSDSTFSSVERYDWLCSHLQEQAQGYQIALTKEIVFKCLMDFEFSVVSPYLSSLSPKA